jgi:prepilin-type N-terminal cleavage/methylation domain-containing protein
MTRRTTTTARGFSLMEMMVSMGIGLIVLGSAVQLFNMGTKSTAVVSQRAELQQNIRAAMELITKDVSMAGSGLPSGGIQLPNGAGSVASLFACDQTGVCHVPGSFQYPTGNYMYGMIPGFQTGVENNAVITSAPGIPCSSITVVYADYNFPLNEYNVTFPANPTGNLINIAPNPNYNPAPPLITAAGGIQVGDLIWLSNSTGSAVGEVTGLSANTISFADNDPLRFNQSGATVQHNIRSITGAPAAQAYRIFVVTYYLTVPNNGQPPRLMRQVNGLTPVPVADNIINLQFAYDSYNAQTNQSVLDPNQPNPIGVGDSLNLIQKVNISVLAQALGPATRNTQNMAMSTSVSARNMAFRNRYK